MEWNPSWTEGNDPFSRYLNPFDALIGDKRTRVTFTEIIKGIIASGSLVCARIAASSPILSKAKEGAQRVIRLATGESTTRSNLDAEHLTQKLRERGVDHLSGSEEDELWLIADGSELRKPHAQALPDLMKVRALDGKLVNGYRTLQVLGVTPKRRGLLYHRLFTSEEPGFISEPHEVQTLLTTVSQAVVKRFKRRIWIVDSGFDDVAVFRTIWEQGEEFVCRVRDKRRRVEFVDRDGVWQEGSIEQARTALQELAEGETTLVVRLVGQTQAKRQKVKVIVSATPLRLTYDPDVRREAPPSQKKFSSIKKSQEKSSPKREGNKKEKRASKRPPTAPKRQETRELWLVEIRLPQTEMEPILVFCSEPVNDAASALRVLQMYRQRWAIEDAYGFTKECLDWEEVQVMDLEGIRTLVALSWVAAGFLYEMGVTFEWEEVQLLAKLGGYVPHKGRQPGRRVLTWGLQRLLEMLATQAFLAQYEAEHGSLPPNIQAILHSLPPPSYL